MKKLKLLTLMSLGVMASSSGMIQVGASTYNYFVDFSTKEVANFNDYKQTFTTDTYNLNNQVNFNWLGSYSMSSCSPTFTINAIWEVSYRINGIAPTITLVTQPLPDLPCQTSPTTYSATATATMPASILEAVVNDDANFVQFRSRMFFSSNSTGAGRVMSFSGYRNFFELEYDFNTTYLFNIFMSDQEYVSTQYAASVSPFWTINSTARNYLQYVFTTAGNDEYYILNSNVSSIGTTRKKYAIDYNQEFFRGESVGAQFDRNNTGTDSFTIAAVGGAFVENIYNYYYLNTANFAQAIVTAPVISFTEETCSGGFLDINVGCFVNNALAYLVNDAPIISDAFTLLNTGIELAAQTFGIIGSFSDDNVFGYLILLGFGFIAVKWFLKNDN
jgi:hypothetical protein